MCVLDINLLVQYFTLLPYSDSSLCSSQGGNQIINYSRENKDTVRKTDDKRKKDREARR